MFSHPELCSDPQNGSGRESGPDTTVQTFRLRLLEIKFKLRLHIDQMFRLRLHHIICFAIQVFGSSSINKGVQTLPLPSTS